MDGSIKSGRHEKRPEWTAGLKRFEEPSTGSALLQVADTLLPYLGMLVLMCLTTTWDLPVWITPALAFPAAALLLRLFMIFHDCAHASFFPSQPANRLLGNFLGVLTFTSFADWRHSHGVHHSSSGNLDRRGIGDVWTMTVDEYTATGLPERLLYRLVRSPLVIFGLGPIAIFLIGNRFPGRGARLRQVLGVLLTDLLLAAIVALAARTVGIETYLLVQLPVAYLAGVGAVWIFYIHHQFDPSYWARTDEWASLDAAMRGSSYYALPPVLQWITASIGLHHVHHLSPRIPNYRLQRCVDAIPELQLQEPLTLGKSMGAVRLNLWDERGGRLLSFRELRAMLQARSRPASTAPTAPMRRRPSRPA